MKGFSLGHWEAAFTVLERSRWSLLLSRVFMQTRRSCVCLSLCFLPSSPPLCSCGPRQSRLYVLTQSFLSPWTVTWPGRPSSSISQGPYLLASALHFLQDSRVISFGYCPHLTLCSGGYPEVASFRSLWRAKLSLLPGNTGLSLWNKSSLAFTCVGLSLSAQLTFPPPLQRDHMDQAILPLFLSPSISFYFFGTHLRLSSMKTDLCKM